MSSTELVNVAREGSYLCSGYELRIAGRCLEEDLSAATDCPFDELQGHEIVRAFVNRRRQTPINTREVTPLTCGKTVYRLAHGHRHRGATWHDEAQGVVWLLAYAQHEFNDGSDAFAYFKGLDADERLLPTPRDYEGLFRDRDRRFTEVLRYESERLLQAARENPGQEQRAEIGGRFGVGVVLEVVETLGEVFLAVKTARLEEEILMLLFASFFNACDFDDIRSVRAIPTRVLGPDELGFSSLIENALSN